MSLAALLMLQVQMSAAHEGKFFTSTKQEPAIHHSRGLACSVWHINKDGS